MKPLLTWFVIINPTSGNGSSKKRWPKIKALLTTHGFGFTFAFTEYENHSTELAKEAVLKGYKNIISIGGDGTLHNIINGVMLQKKVGSNKINIGVIPIGTGNDWVRTHTIPKQLEDAIKIIKKGTIKHQDLGRIDFLDSKKPSVYFNNLAGIGFDGYVASNTKSLKKIGALSYLVAALKGLFVFKNFNATLTVNEETFSSKSLMVLIGLCKYTGGGMQLTNSPNFNDGLFDISIIGNMSKWDIIKNIRNLYNGKVASVKHVKTLKTKEITIKLGQNKNAIIQADGEVLGNETIRLTIVPNTLSFYSN